MLEILKKIFEKTNVHRLRRSGLKSNQSGMRRIRCGRKAAFSRCSAPFSCSACCTGMLYMQVRQLTTSAGQMHAFHSVRHSKLQNVPRRLRLRRYRRKSIYNVQTKIGCMNAFVTTSRFNKLSRSIA